MKTFKTAMIATIITVALILTCGIAMAHAESDFYAKNALVTGFESLEDSGLWIITVVDENGEQWDFLDDESFYRVGDVVVLRMMDLSNEHDEADEICDVMFIKHLNTIEMMQWF